MPDPLLDCIEIDPPGPARACVIWLHGLGADGHDFEPIVDELHLPGHLAVRFVLPHAPMQTVTINAGMRMRAWYDILEMSIDRRVDTDGLLASADALQALIRRELDNGMAADRIVLAGFSQGGAVVLHTGLRFDQRLAGIIALSTYMPTADSLADEAAEANRDVPLFMAHGRFDPVVPYSLGHGAAERLKAMKYRFEWHAYPMAHQVCMEEIGAIANWLQTILT